MLPIDDGGRDGLNAAGIEPAIGHRFADRSLLRRALTHRSCGPDHNERLEFLGDSVLNFLIATLIFERHPGMREGHMSRLRANLVRQDTLHGIAGELTLGDHILLGEGELRSGGASRPSILADALEALIGAVFLDGGLEAARALVLRLFETRLAEVDTAAPGKDAKTALQEWLQARRHPLPRYELRGTHGESHAQEFEVGCRIDALNITTCGRGASRRAAEQSAAQLALQALGR